MQREMHRLLRDVGLSALERELLFRAALDLPSESEPCQQHVFCFLAMRHRCKPRERNRLMSLQESAR